MRVSVENRPGWSVSRFTVGGTEWVRLYLDSLGGHDNYVAQFRQGKKYLVHYITGKRFTSIERSVQFYGSLPPLAQSARITHPGAEKCQPLE